MITQTSLQAYDGIQPLKSELHQRILGVLAWRPMHREQLARETRMRDNTCRPRVRELLDIGAIDIVGLTIVRGQKVEVLGIRHKSI